ncbi:hypothetical protein SORBI_3001G221601 [Sorghum bicolor]|uniref:Uncharacterized protein n=1 Tax=Sorghum bicolor TaxID=4558 RepID=A0A1Z5S747_SORBI|nr:hypothetical protein SORBI_3001G221601 [Sorghum bicolor]OQU91649.1 hypothetical protein SORBI_3001G221601 [Sorghum bicolor]
MKRQQHRKNYPSGIRSADGQTTLKSFLFKPRVVDGVQQPPPPPPPPEGVMEAPISPPEPPKREIVRVTKAIIKEKPSAFSSVGSAGKDGAGGADGALNAAVFKRFHSSAPGAKVEGGHVEAGEDGDLGFGGSGDAPRLDVESRRDLRSKRKSPFGSDEHGSDAKARRVLVLGDDPRPRPASSQGLVRPTRGGRGRGRGGEGGRTLYNHCKIEIPCPEFLLTPTRAGAGGGTATWRAWTGKRSAGRTTCGRGWDPSRSAAWSGTSCRRPSAEHDRPVTATTTGRVLLVVVTRD